MIDYYIEYTEDLAEYIQSGAQLHNFTIFSEPSTGIGGRLDLMEVNVAGPDRFGREVTYRVRIQGPKDNWKEIMQYVGKVDNLLTDCASKDNELLIKYRLTLGAWSLTEEEPNLIFENSLIARMVRLEVN